PLRGDPQGAGERLVRRAAARRAGGRAPGLERRSEHAHGEATERCVDRAVAAGASPPDGLVRGELRARHGQEQGRPEPSADLRQLKLLQRPFLTALSLAAALAAQAQDYPSRPIRLITPAAPGGTTDLLARIFGAKLSESLKQQVIVDNRASASGVIAGEITAKAPPDGYTWLLANHQNTPNPPPNPSRPHT